MKARITSAFVVAFALSLVGCSASTVSELPGSPGTPSAAGSRLGVTGLSSSGDDALPRVEAYGRDRTLTIVTRGSSSCPFVPTVEEIDESASVARVSLDPIVSEACTADDAPRTFTFDVEVDASALAIEVVEGEG